MGFLLGILAILGVLMVVFCGEFVVGCVVTVVNRRSLFEVLKVRQVFEIYFSERCA
jgi:hypothetical protein